MAAQIVNVIQNAKEHVLEVELLDTWTAYESQPADPNDPLNPATVMVAVTRTYVKSVPTRKSHFNGLSTVSKRIAYAKECMEVHHPTDPAKAIARRALWDADDKAKADAAAAAAKAAEEAKFIVVPQGYVKDDKGTVGGVQVTVTHQGHTCSCVIPPDVAQAETNAREAWQASKGKADAEANSLAAFGLVK